MKQCRKCGETKPLTEFHKQSKAKDGLQSRCKACAIAATRANYEANREARLARQAAYRAEHREEMRAYLREYYLKNPERYKKTDPEKIEQQRHRQWLRHQDPKVREAKRARDREAYRKNPEVWKAGAMRRRAREQGAPIRHFTDRDWRRIVERQRGECHYCGVTAPLTKEHLIPLSRGGAHSVGNIVAACMDCNARKHTRTRMEFLVWLRRKAVA